MPSPPPVTLPAVCTTDRFCTDATVTSSPARTTASSPISAITSSATTDTSTMPAAPVAPPAIPTAVCRTLSRLSAATVTSFAAVAEPSIFDLTFFLNTCVSMSKVTPTPPMPMPELILLSCDSDAAMTATDCAVLAAELSPPLMVAFCLTSASVVEFVTVVATTPATPTAPPATPIGAKFISSLVTAATRKPRIVSLVNSASIRSISRCSALPS